VVEECVSTGKVESGCGGALAVFNLHLAVFDDRVCLFGWRVAFVCEEKTSPGGPIGSDIEPSSHRMSGGADVDIRRSWPTKRYES
jgi:hypothetical protein